MELKTLWLCMAAVFLVFGFVGWLKPHWFLSCAWTLHPHHISPETIEQLHGLHGASGLSGVLDSSGAIEAGKADDGEVDDAVAVGTAFVAAITEAAAFDANELDDDIALVVPPSADACAARGAFRHDVAS